ncbi:glycoside hydrolase family 31 protein [Evansella cellulosilytica]|uniref:Alpha-glucosidase n=1 Tax=Evansella cellulosilytica (strain ATCC 21833 / DSM 2522 / FERM P-1141 / JCM 9156 / N-4) TaxID=649639 RepID=E6TTZ8_EVAC2|nr:glycoside hydrolase family 31 protein [Evansella cellulosilytica]ADU32029.1 Alpha-glucosidase [Evansella cellulosilytica DSM 2522]
MEDTSFAILPENKKHGSKVNYQSLGTVKSYNIENNAVVFQCDNGYVSILFYRDDIVRIIMNHKGRPSYQSSFAVVGEREQIKPHITEGEKELRVASEKLTLVIKRDQVSISIFDHHKKLLVKDDHVGMGFNDKNEVICYKQMDAEDHFYGFGEKTSFLDKRGEKMTMWNTDVYAPHNPEIDSLYQSIPYFMTVRNGKAHGIYFDNTFKTVFDMKTSDDTYSFSAEGGQLDYYVFAGPSPKEVVAQFSELTGKMPLPPKWALGYHQSRYSYETEEEVRDVVNTFKEKDIPLDAIYLDLHYMNGYRVFTFDEGRFPNPKKLLHDLKNQGVRVVPIVDPGVKVDPEYNIYQEGVRNDQFCKYIEGDIYTGDVWPGESAFPDFTNSEVRRWWGKNHQFYSDLGIEGIWNDMNEPAVFNETKTMDIKVMHDNDGDPKTHRELHNLYGLLMGEATYEGMKNHLKGNRPFLLTRAGFAGVQRYAAVWTGDNRSFWEHLQMAIPMCMNLGISGVPFCGPDVGGFAHDSNGQLLARWTQFGTFTPFFRNHSELNSIHQEPWMFGEKYEAVVKKYIQERYVWLPYLYTLFQEASVTGEPVMRPLVLEYPNDKNTFNLSDQFLIGADVLVAPITTPDTYHRVVYLPEGNWVNYWTEVKLEGGKHHLVQAALDILPIFVKEGSILTHGTVKSSTEAKETELKVHIYVTDEEKSTFTYYEDDGKSFEYERGSFYQCRFEAKLEKNRLDILTHVEHDEYQPEWKNAVFVIHGIVEDLEVFVNGNVQNNSKRLADNKLEVKLGRNEF